MAGKDQVTEDDQIKDGDDTDNEQDDIGNVLADNSTDLSEDEILSLEDELTDEERAALAEMRADEASEDDEDEDDDDDAANAAADIDGEEEDDGADANVDDVQSATDAQPVNVHQIPDDVPVGDALAKRLEDLQADKDALLDEYDDGDIDRDELRKRQAEIDTEVTKLQSDAATHEQLRQRDMQTLQDNWKSTVSGYMTENADLRADPEVLKAFDAQVRALSNDPVYAKLPDRRLLEVAHDQLIATADVLELDVPARTGGKPDPKAEEEAAKAAEKEAKAQAEADKLPKKKPREERPDPPKTLRNIPQSDTRIDATPFDTLDGILESGDPEAIENAMRKLTPEERDAYVRM